MRVGQRLTSERRWSGNFRDSLPNSEQFDLSRALRYVLGWLIAVIALAPAASGQTDGYLHINDEVHSFLERQQALGNLRGAFLDEQPLSARRAHRYLDSLAVLQQSSPEVFSPTDSRLLAQFRGDEPLTGASWVNDRFSPLYRNGTDFYSVEHGPLRLQINPKLYLSGGGVSEEGLMDGDPRSFIYQNTRAVRVSGRLGSNFFYHAQLEENQRIEPMLARERTRHRLPLAYQRDSTLFDYVISQAAFGYQDQHVEVRLARDRHRWGPARNALYYSNHAPPHTSLQARAEVWRLSFTAHYAVMDDDALPPPSHLAFRPVKYGAFHRLGINLPGRVSLGIYEGIILALQPGDERLGNYIRFLNPLLFFNAVDRESNSPGNVLVGMDAHWVPTRGLTVYGQFILDDFEAGRLFTDGGYWKNTWGLLAGVHTVDLGVDGLEVRAETARIRPYVYANVTGSLAHTHRLGQLGSPAGPNSQTTSLDINYRPTSRISTSLRTFLLHRGRSTDGLNYGEDPFVAYNENRVSDDEVFTLQGIRQTRRFAEGRIGYEFLPSMWLDGVLRYESFDDAEDGFSRATSFLIQLRWGMPAQHPLF